MQGWKELASTLGITVTMLHYLRTGARNPSPKLLRRINELETEAGLVSPVPSRLLVKESEVSYTTKREAKHIDIVEIRRQVADLKRQVASLEKLLEESNADHD
jgi:transcriptional regulator with XRE-family HTH domain